uniref:Uncharacterized protein n=1 Tax=Rhizophora mucronata TaxID=61149 RepID=A0A2P2LFM4_RHIMU
MTKKNSNSHLQVARNIVSSNKINAKVSEKRLHRKYY